MANDIYINGKTVAIASATRTPYTEHPAITIQRQEHDKRIKSARNPKVTKANYLCGS